MLTSWLQYNRGGTSSYRGQGSQYRRNGGSRGGGGGSGYRNGGRPYDNQGSYGGQQSYSNRGGSKGDGYQSKGMATKGALQRVMDILYSGGRDRGKMATTMVGGETVEVSDCLVISVALCLGAIQEDDQITLSNGSSKSIDVREWSTNFLCDFGVLCMCICLSNCGEVLYH